MHVRNALQPRAAPRHAACSHPLHSHSCCCRAAKRKSARAVEVTVQAEQPEQGAISEHITADAILAPLAQAAIAPKITAPVHKFYVQRGANVKEGQLLATLENTDLAAAALDNKGSYMAAAGCLRHRHQGAGP